jgi:beta-phosphoglucomutase
MTGMIKDGIISLIIFDMDGVIADTTEGHRLAWKEYLKGYDRPLSDSEFLSFYGSNNEEIYNTLFPGHNFSAAELQQMSEDKETLFRRRSGGQIKTYPGFFEFLDNCDSMRIPMAVGSSANRSNVDFVLEELEITGRFIATVTSDDVEFAKPEPDIFLKAVSLAGGDKKTTLVIEDSPIGIRAANSAGIRVAGLTTTHPADKIVGADLIVEDFFELMNQTSLGSKETALVSEL